MKLISYVVLSGLGEDDEGAFSLVVFRLQEIFTHSLNNHMAAAFTDKYVEETNLVVLNLQVRL